jgi:hypothetical protein
MAGTFKGTVRYSGTTLCHVIQTLCSDTCLSSVAVSGGGLKSQKWLLVWMQLPQSTRVPVLLTWVTEPRPGRYHAGRSILMALTHVVPGCHG